MVTLVNGSQTIAKGIGSTCPLLSLPITYVLYVPDSPFNSISISKLTSLKSFLQSQFHTKDLGMLRYFLGIEVIRSKHGIFLS